MCRDDKKIDWLLAVWKTTVGVQQHFKDIELRIRNYAITVMGAFLGVAARNLL